MDQAVQLSSRARAVTLLQQLNHSVMTFISVSELSAFHWCAMVVVFSLHVIISVLFLLDEPMGGWVQKRIFFSKRLREDQEKFVP